ncbi:Purine nucleoside phosphorylase [Pseudolycoriella hygida]|uniref:Purine nucleoside phosphorylase n=1 Tax=Pseudolycoriella hygida TaxID=35572 RepID=A0A9Q0RXF3_9DIPT|nr:Purine nucleoside phosphorylase [Pseudolycoriella hygida]
MNGIKNNVLIDLNGNGYTNGKCTNGTIYHQDDDIYTYDTLNQIAKFFLDRTKVRPKIGIICGSGLGAIAEMLEDVDKFPYSSIPNFPVSTVEGHAGQMLFGYLDNVPVMCMQGRFHYYEGYPLAKCSMPIRVMKLVGVTHLIATNAAGGLNPSYKVGDIVIVKDHINIMGFAGNNPLQGPNDTRFGPRFPPMNKAYDRKLIEYAMEIAEEMGMKDEVHEGVYTCLGGPNYETVAELKMLKILGVDAVGMSTVHEVITARHCDITAFAFSIITNKCVTEYESMEEANHDEVVDVGKRRQSILSVLVCKMVTKINDAAL